MNKGGPGLGIDHHYLDGGGEVKVWIGGLSLQQDTDGTIPSAVCPEDN